MTEPLAAIYADFVDTRRVKTRKVLQIILEVSLEQEPEIMRALGWPNPAISLPVAIARLAATQDAGSAQRSAEESPSLQEQAFRASFQDVAGDTPIPVKKAKAFKDLPRSQQAAIKCQDEEFQYWLMNDIRPQDGRYWPDDVKTIAQRTDRVLKEHLVIESKKELDTNQSRATAWDGMLTSYEYRNQLR